MVEIECEEECRNYAHCDKTIGKCLCDEGYGLRTSDLTGKKICQVNNRELEHPMTQCQTRVDKLFFGDASRSDREKESRFQAGLKLTRTLTGLDILKIG